MIRRIPLCFAVAAMVTVAPVPGLVDAVFADGSNSKSLAATRHDLTDESAGETIITTRSKGRRATRGDSSAETTNYVQTRAKRSRRNPGADAPETTRIATFESVETDLIALAEAETDGMAKHVRNADFEGNTGKMALYQLTGKAAAGMPLTPVEMKALGKLLETKQLSALIKETEAHLMDVAGEVTTLDAIAAALGIPRPATGPAARSNLGASLMPAGEDGRG